MARMSDEQYELMQDTRDKAITARSARSTRTHNGKRGPVVLPHDNLSKKELEALNGKCETYRLNSPMTWAEFKKMPLDLQIDYIKLIRNKFNAPSNHIAKMMGVSHRSLSIYLNKHGLSRGRNYEGRNKWDKDGFLAWAGMVEVDEKIEEETESKKDAQQTVDIHDEFTEESVSESIVEGDTKTKTCECDLAEHCEDKRIYEAGPIAFAGNSIPVLAKSGNMTFNNNHADDILKTLKTIMGNAKVDMTISWYVMED